MKNRVLYVLFVLMLSVLCIGCAPDTETDADQPVTDTQQQEVETQETEPVEEESTAPENVGRVKIEDVQVIADVTELIKAEKAFVYELDCVWPENEKQYKISGKMYRIVDKEVATSWEDYEEAAKNYYTEEYIEEEFTPFYTGTTKTFVEKKGRLYRAESDGVANPLVEGSIEIFESTDGKYYVSFFEDAGGEEWEQAYLVKPAEDKPYGYVIVEKIGVVK